MPPLDSGDFRSRIRAPMNPNYCNSHFTHALAAPPAKRLRAEDMEQIS